MLTDIEVLTEIESDRIRIEPFNEKKVAPAAYYFTLGKHLLIPKPNQTIKLTGDDDPEYTEIDIENKPYTIKPDEFLLGQTAESLTLANNIGMFLDGRTTLARLGLTIHQTATFIHPGHSKSIITLEIKNNGNHDIELTSGIDIGKGVFFKSTSDAMKSYKDTGIYKSQLKVTGADVPPYISHK
jgi:dCTP deaminase